MAKHFAQLELKSADLSTDFGLEWATKLFGAEAIASLPIRAAGKNKGKPKGFVIWRKITVAGYCREVMTPLAVGQLADAWIGAGCYTSRGEASRGLWLGRVQSLAASAPAGFFFDQGRQREMERQAQERARWADEVATITAA